MPEAKALREVFLDELRDTYDAEKQLIKALPKLASAASHPELRAAFTDHLQETRIHAERVEQVFKLMGERARGKHCHGMAGIIEEGKAVLEDDVEEPSLDAVLIAAGQRAEHYELAAYGALVAWADVLELDGAAALLQRTLEEEGAADKRLSALAEGGINQAAARVGTADDESDESDRARVGPLLRPSTGRKAPARPVARTRKTVTTRTNVRTRGSRRRRSAR